MDVQVAEHVAVQGRETRQPVADLGDDDLVPRKDDVSDPGPDLVVRVQMGEVRHRLRPRRQVDHGNSVSVRRPGSPQRRMHSGIFPARSRQVGKLANPCRSSSRARSGTSPSSPRTGKTSLVEAMLFQSGATNRLGSVESSSTVSDWDEDEQRRQMSLAASVCHAEWQERKINLVDTPGDPGFQADTLAALRVVEGALFVVNGVNSVEVQTTRIWERAEALGLCRVVFVTMLDRERADFFTARAARSQLSGRCVAVQIPIGHEHELEGIVDLFHMRAYLDPNGERESKPVDIPRRSPPRPPSTASNSSTPSSRPTRR